MAQTSRTRVNAPIERPFDVHQDRLPPQFTGNSITAIFNAVQHRLDLRKSEFESDARYQERIAKLSNSRLVGDVPLNGTIAVALTCDTSEPHRECDHYDAESGSMYVEVPFLSVQPGTGSDEYQPASIQVKEEASRRIPAGIAQNGFGARFAISSQDVTRYFIDAVPPYWLNAASVQPAAGETNPRFELQMIPEQAMRAKSNLRELIIGRITPPFLGDVEDAVNEPRQSYPIRTSMHVRSIHMTIDEVWFYNSRTGEVYRRIRPA